MELIRPGTSYDFIGKRRVALTMSLVLVVLALVVTFVRGLRLGVEFRGGWEIEVSFGKPVQTDALRAALASAGGGALKGGFEIQQLGNPKQGIYLIRAPGEVERKGLGQQIVAATAGLGPAKIRRFESVGARVGSDLFRRGLLALFMAFVAIFAYVAIRFPWRFAPGAVVALIHDTTVTVGVVALLGREFTLPVLAALLTLIGYSTNDTIVVYDRIRENLRRKRRPELANLMNLSINETLGRTILTSGTVLVASLSLLFFGGPVLRDFALVLTVGVIIGTYSSIYIAGALTLEINQRWPGPKF
jgi:preprotein translocase subunit SecF